MGRAGPAGARLRRGARLDERRDRPSQPQHPRPGRRGPAASTQQTSASTQQIAASAQELAQSARELQKLTERFRLPGHDHQVAAGVGGRDGEEGER